MTATDAVPAVEDEQWHRLSPRMLLVHPVIELGRSIPALLGLLLAGSANGNGARWGLVGTAVVLVLSLSRWFTTRLRITPAQVQLQHGLFRRRVTAAPVDRIRTVDVTSHLMHRVLGLARVVIGTGTSDRAGRGRLVLDGLTVDTAARLRADLLHRTPLAPDAEQPVPTRDGDRPIAVLDPGWIRYAPFTLSGAFTVLLVYGFAVRLDREAHVNLLQVGPLHAAGRALRGAPVAVDVAAGAVALLAFVTLASLAGYALAFWNFRLTGHPGGTLHVTRGLVTSRATSIERRRLVGVELSEPLLLRLVGGARTLAVATGLRARRGAERGGEVLLPPAPRSVALGVAAAVLDGAQPLAGTLRPHPPAARRRRLLRAILGGLAIVALLTLPRWTGGNGTLGPISALFLPLTVPLALDRYRNLGHDLVGGYVVMRFGSLVRRHSAVATSGVIGWDLRSTFFQRRAGLATLTATTAAGKQRYRAVDLDARDAVAFADAALPGLLTGLLVPAAPPDGCTGTPPVMPPR